MDVVYVKAKECKQPLSAEDFAIVLGKHFTSFYRQVTAAIVHIVEKPWERISINGQPHEHGFKLGSEKHTTEVMVQKSGGLQVISGIQGLAVLKTTQAKSGATHHFRCALLAARRSGFEGFIRDKYTILPETRERMLATEVTATWSGCTVLCHLLNKGDVRSEKGLSLRLVGKSPSWLTSALKRGIPPMWLAQDGPPCRPYPFETLTSIPGKQLYFMEKYLDVKKVLINTFFGSAIGGVYSPSVQSTLYHMAKSVLDRVSDVSSIQLKMPNIHFLPVNLSSKDNSVIVKFDDDVYLPTDEPHGSIEATLSRIRSKM
ncbi:hypothetical protein OROMI_033988 [Orobanche minor]